MDTPTVHSDFIQRIAAGSRHVTDGMVEQRRRVGSMGYGRFALTMARSSSAGVPVAGDLPPGGRPAPSDLGPLTILIAELEAP